MDYFYTMDFSLVKKKLIKKNILEVDSFSNLYKNKDKIIKIFTMGFTDYKKYEKFCEIIVPSFAFPDSLILYENKFVGYIMEFISGNTFDKLPSNTNINNMLKSFDEIDKDIQIISNNHIEINDLHNRNIIYNELSNKITFIDTDCYKIRSNISKEELYKINIFDFRMLLLYLYNLLIFNEESIFDKYICNYNKSTLEVFKELILFIENKYNHPITTLYDIKILKK